MLELVDRHVLIIGGRSGIARAIAAAVAVAGGIPLLAGRTPGPADSRLDLDLDLDDEASIARAIAALPALDHVVCAAAAPANGALVTIESEAIDAAFAAKVRGPLLVAKHAAPRLSTGSSITLFSGFVSERPARERAVMATLNGAVDALARALAVELAPIRVNSVSPGIVDSGAWDRLGEAKAEFLRSAGARSLTGAVGDPADLAELVVLLMRQPAITGATIRADSGAVLV